MSIAGGNLDCRDLFVQPCVNFGAVIDCGLNHTGFGNLDARADS
jgi:hypothetical protein